MTQAGSGANRCPACGHPPTVPRPISPFRRVLGLPAAAPGCSIREVNDGRAVWGCTCRHAFHDERTS